MILGVIAAFSISSAVSVARRRGVIEANVRLLVGLQGLADRLVAGTASSADPVVEALRRHPGLAAESAQLSARLAAGESSGSPESTRESLGAVTALVTALRRQNAMESEELGASIDRLYLTVGLLVALCGVTLELLRRVRAAARMLERAAEQRIESAQREHAEQLALVSALAASTAHEVNNPLTAVMLNLALIKSRGAVSEPVLADAVAVCLDGTNRIRDIVAAMRGLGVTAAHSVSIARVVAATLRLLDHRIEPRARIKLRLDEVGPVRADYVGLGQVLSNLVVNAVEAFGDRPADANQVTLEAVSIDSTWAELSVSDNGPGFPPGDLDRLTKAFFTTKATGSGLGLFVCSRLVEKFGGTLTLGTAATGGARVSVRLRKAEDS